jgi:hypothetical protein
MTRLRVFAAVVAGLLTAAAADPAVAQGGPVEPTGSRLRLYFQDLAASGDSAYLAAAGGDFRTLVQAYDNRGQGLTAFAFRVYFDPAVVAFDSARSSCPDSLAFPLQAPVLGPNYVELSAGGCTNATAYQHNVATLAFHLQGAASAGSGLYLEPLALTDRIGTGRVVDGEGYLAEVCLAVGLWGDVDDDARVNSRDALIALSNAVGLPTPGYIIARGDVDADGYVGSRDALAMLSASIGYAPAYGFRTGKGIPVSCAPEALLPRTSYYIRAGANPGVPGVSGLVVRTANDSAVVIVGDSAYASLNEGQGIRVSPDGAFVAFTCLWQGYQDICRANADGSGLLSLTAGSFSSHNAADWSPASDSIVFLRNNQIWLMASDGSNPHVIPSTPGATSVAWAPVAGSRRIAYTTDVYPGQVRTRDLDSAGTDSLVFDFGSTTGWSNYGYYPRRVDWSPAGDSLAFSLLVNGYGSVFVAPRSGGALARRGAVYNGASFATFPNWTTAGILYTSYESSTSGSQYRVFVLRPDGRVERLRRPDTQANWAAGMDKQ